MSTKRPPAPPPVLPGYTYVSLLGSGGFSDVYLYQQERPRRRVAVKVLVADLRNSGAQESFEAEANLMAQLSTHPYIVTIYEAHITESGHSYLAMEYCSRPSLDVRYRRGRFSVDEALSIGIKVASAVETAHRAGIAHRDIKPANILVTDYNRPALTDFGISASLALPHGDDTGMSIPWSPPESFTGAAVDGVKVDVWGLGATIYTLLAGRSPFVRPGADNSQRALISRIANEPLAPLQRADVPESLEMVLATAMFKSPTSRFASAQEFARALMRVQSELNLAVTDFEVLEEHSTDFSDVEDPDATVLRGVVAIDAQQSENRFTYPTKADIGAPQRIEVPRYSVEDHPDAYADSAPESAGMPTGRKVLLGAAAVVLVGGLVGGAVALNGTGGTPSATPSSSTSKPKPTALVTDATPPAPTKLTAKPSSGGATWTWENPSPQPGDVYIWAPVSAVSDGTYQQTTKPQAFVSNNAQNTSCIAVKVVRQDGHTSTDVRDCYPK
ncbi:MAG: serine/threonine protein kinase [Acidobacteria bacterium]|nr:serine/threonine protein kinase [Acidobacteriota bacterium]